MTEEEIKQKFKETYPDFMRGETPLSPYFDIWCYGIEIMEQENNKLLDVINNQDVKIADLEQKLEQSKEILAKLIEEEKNNMYWEMNGSDKSSYYDVRKQAEQFLKEIEKTKDEELENNNQIR